MLAAMRPSRACWWLTLVEISTSQGNDDAQDDASNEPREEDRIAAAPVPARCPTAS
jgi:hypothetical protein